MKHLLHSPTLLLLTGVFMMAAHSMARDWYVAPDGSPAGAGTKESPWDIASALIGSQPIGAGDTVYLTGGVYKRRPQERFFVRLAGEEGKPIHIRPAPGNHAAIDGGLYVESPSTHLWIWDLEMFVSEPNPDHPVSPGSWPADLNRPAGGLEIRSGVDCKYINLVIHDTLQAVSFWSGAVGGEVHGCILYDNGWIGTDRGHGHAIYTQNQEGVKIISDCVMTGGYSYTLHAYGSAKATVDHYLAEGNIVYAAGPFLIGGGRPSHDIRVYRNVIHGSTLRIGYDAPENEDCDVRENLIVDGKLQIVRFKSTVNEDNLVIGRGEPRPSGDRVILRPNKYDPNRANLAILNWERKPSVAVDFAPFLTVGGAFRLMNPRDFFGEPVLSGIYDGNAVDVPVKDEFGAFVVLKE